MSEDTAPGDMEVGTDVRGSLITYAAGLGLAGLLTAVSFFLCRTQLFWLPSIPVALVVLAIAQMGVHIVFFLHVTSGPDHLNNIMALAFGVLIVFLIMTGSIWIMAHLNGNMMGMPS